MNKIQYTEKDIPDIANKLIGFLADHDVMTFTGPLGAGKTSLIKEMFRLLGVKEHVTSPTFTYVNQYPVAPYTYYHFDLYRVNSLQDFGGAGFDEYLYKDKAKCMIEWPEIIMPLLKDRACHVQIDYLEEDPSQRVISWHSSGGVHE